ncbi:unnamed protein product, partial [marine sediment metagenome]
GINLLDDFKKILDEAPVIDKRFRNGREIYETYVEPSMINLYRVGAHVALSSIFEEYCKEGTNVYSYYATVEDREHLDAGVQQLASGRATIQSTITLEKVVIDMVALYLGDHNLFVALGTRMADKQFQELHEKVNEAFKKGDNNEVMRLMNLSFGDKNYSISHLFKDQQRKIINRLLEATWRDIESSFRRIYEHNYAIMLTLRNMNMPLPKALSAPAEFIINEDFCKEIRSDEMNLEALKNLAEEAQRLSLNLDHATICFEGASKINKLMQKFSESTDDIELLLTIDRVLKILK